MIILPSKHIARCFTAGCRQHALLLICSLTLFAHLGLGITARFASAQGRTTKTRVPPQLKKVVKKKGQKEAAAPAAGEPAAEAPTPKNDTETQRERLLAGIDKDEKQKMSQVKRRISRAMKEIARLEANYRTAQKKGADYRLLQTKTAALEGTRAELAKAEAELRELPEEFEQARNKIKMEHPLPGEDFVNFRGRIIPRALAKKTEQDEAKREARNRAIAAGAKAEADKYINARLGDGTFRSAAYTNKAFYGMFGVSGEQYRALAAAVEDDFLVDRGERSGRVIVLLYYYQVEYVSQAGLVNNREGYVPVVPTKGGGFATVHDGGTAYFIGPDDKPTIDRRTGTYEEAGFSLKK